jgi:hypothetical protein
MPAPFTPANIQASLRNASDPKAQAFANDMEVVNGVWRVLAVTLELLAEVHSNGGVATIGDAKMFVAKKAVAAGGLGAGDSEAAKRLVFAGATFISVAETGAEVVKMARGKAVVFVTLKVAEVIVSAAGMGQVDKCKLALIALTVSGGLNVLSCVGTFGGLCILGAASFALEAIEAHAQCKLPPTGAI